MILDKNRFVLNDQSISSSHNEPQRFPGFVQKLSPEMFCKKREFLKISKISEENILFERCSCSRDTPTFMFYYEICEIFKNPYFEEHLRKTASISFTSKSYSK